MEPSRRKATPLSLDELHKVFEVVNEGKDQGKARMSLPERDRITVNKAFNVIKEFNLRSMDVINDDIAGQIAKKAKYSATVSYVQRLFSSWLAWRRGGAEIVDDRTHQYFLKGQFNWLRRELEALSASFPKEWNPYYWPGNTSPRLKGVGNDKAGRMVWELDIEQKYGWPFLLEHLRTGLPDTFKAVEEVKGSYARYCQLWQALEERYRAQAQALQDQEPGEVNLNGSFFYWSILNEVDQGSEKSREAEYRVQPGPEGIVVVYAKRQLVQAEDEETLQRWADRHREWRREVLREYKGEMDHVRREVQSWVEVVVQAGQELEIGAKVAGTCERCSGAVRGSTGMMSERISH